MGRLVRGAIEKRSAGMVTPEIAVLEISGVTPYIPEPIVLWVHGMPTFLHRPKQLKPGEWECMEQRRDRAVWDWWQDRERRAQSPTECRSY